MKKKPSSNPIQATDQVAASVATLPEPLAPAKRGSSKAAKVKAETIAPPTVAKPRKKSTTAVESEPELNGPAVSARLDRTDPLFPLASTSNQNNQDLSKFDLPFASKSSPVPRVLSCQNIECAYASDVGRVRDNNEDNLGAFMALVPGYGEGEMLFGFVVVADGMGGYERGEVASQLAVRTTMTQAIQQIYFKAIAGQALGAAGETTAETLVKIIDEANSVVVYHANRERNTMGTTLVCALLVGNMIYTGNIGDSRLYGLRRQTAALEQITTDHSVVQRLVETGQLTPEEAANSPQRSLLYRSLGQANAPAADTTLMDTSDFTYLLLCSDGLWDMVEDALIEQILRNSSSPAIACRRLINAANQQGGVDNVSVIVVKIT